MRSIWTAIAILLAIGLSLSACQREPASPPPVEKAPTPSVEREPTPVAKGGPAPAVETVPAPPAERELVVAIKEAPPFVMKRDDGSYYGIGIDLWHRVADRLQLRYGFLEQPDAAALIKGIAEGTYDVSFGALSVSADRARLVDFTQPFFATGLGIAVSSGESRLFSVSRIYSRQTFFRLC